MKQIQRWWDVVLVVAGVVMMSLEVWRDHKAERDALMPQFEVPSEPELDEFPDRDAIMEEYPFRDPMFALRPALRMVN